MSQKKYCEKYDVDYNKFCNMRYRLVYKRDQPELYAKLVSIRRKQLESGAPSAELAKAHGIKACHLSEIGTHLGYLDLLEEIKLEKEPSPMKFIHVPSVNLPFPTPQEHEVLEQKNDLEISISKGIKVTIAPNIDSMKIIKIIELLKDL